MIKNEKHQGMIVIAHNIRSLHNVGSIFRSCDAFAVDKLYLTGITGQPPRKEIAKVALGSEHRVAWEYRESIEPLIDELRLAGRAIVALENTNGSQPIDDLRVEHPIALIVGNEVNGMPPAVLSRCHAVVEIPMLGAKQSLNVSVALGIALFALRPRSA